MDYGFAPAGDAHNASLRAMFTRRPNTTVVHQAGVNTIQELIGHLDANVTKPIGDLLIGTHSSSKGFLDIPLSHRQEDRTDFEAFHDSIGSTHGSAKIPDPLIGYTAGAAITNSFHIKGCNVGRDRTDATRAPDAPFLVKIKEALGGNVKVTAPKHFHGLESVPDLGIFEYMAYEFKVGVKPVLVGRRLRGFANKAAAVSAFTNAQFFYSDGTTAVPDTEWGARIPANVSPRYEIVRVPLGTKVGTRQTMEVKSQFRRDDDDITWPIEYTGTPVPSTEATQTNELRASIQADLPHKRFDPTHAWPQFERLGFTSFADFFAGYRWTFSVAGQVLMCKGLRYIYTVLVPIVDRTTGNAIFNFYPAPGSSVAPILNGLAVTDPQYFAVV